MIDKPPPFEGFNISIPFIAHTNGKGFSNTGLHETAAEGLGGF